MNFSTISTQANVPSFTTSASSVPSFSTSAAANSTSAAGSSRRSSTKPAAARQPAAKQQAYNITTKISSTDVNFANYVAEFRDNHKLSAPIVNYLSFADIAPALSYADVNAEYNLLVFDNGLLATRLIKDKADPALPSKLCVSISDIRQLYGDISDAYITKFKDKYKLKTINSQASEISDSEASKVSSFNTTGTPVIEGNGQWLNIAYLIPFCMETSPNFNRRMSNAILSILLASPYSDTYNPLNITSSILTGFKNNAYPKQPATLFKPVKAEAKSDATSSESISATPKKEKPTTKIMVYQQQNFINPGMIDPTAESIVTAFGLNQAYLSKSINPNDADKYMKLYSSITNKQFNPADKAVTDDILKHGLTSKISFLTESLRNMRDDPLKHDEYDRQMKGIKIKVVKSKSKANGTTMESEGVYESQASITYYEFVVPDYVTIQKIYEYCVANNKDNILQNIFNKPEEGKKITKMDVAANVVEEIAKIAQSEEFKQYVESTKPQRGSKTNKNSTASAVGAAVPPSFQTSNVVNAPSFNSFQTSTAPTFQNQTFQNQIISLPKNNEEIPEEFDDVIDC